jgi:hypothetical protein
VDVVVVVKSRRIGWAEHAARMTGNGNASRYLEEAVINKRPLSRLGLDGRIILKWKLKEENGREGLL